jgi:hypothetical protein
VIKINLASRKKSSISAEVKSVKGASQLFKGAQFDELKALPLRKIALPLFVVLFASYILDSYKEETLEKLDRDIAKQKAEETKIRNSLNRMKEYESLKVSLESDEILIRTKLNAVDKLMLDRGSITKMLLSTSSAIPKDVWLTDLKVDQASVTFVGSSLGFNQISDFMKNLNDGQFFTMVELVNSQQAKVLSEIASFELKAKRK